MVIDGTAEASERIPLMLSWDVNNGVARRAWAQNEGAEFAAEKAMQMNKNLQITLPHRADDAVIDKALRR
jgi:urocanate hydratase